MGVDQRGFELRPYQREAIRAILAARRRGVRRQLLCLPTGAGKTVIFSELARIANKPVLVLAHRQELVQQAVDKLARSLGTGAVIGVEQAGQRARGDCRAVVASLRSLSAERLQALRAHWEPGLVIYDECHHAPAEDNRRVLEGLSALSADGTGTLLGVTATPVRADGLPLGDLFEEIVYHKDLRSMIAEGWLVPLRGVRIETGLSLDGDIDRADGGDAEPAGDAEVDLDARNDLVARSIQELARDRRTIVFCQTVAHARNLARTLNGIGHEAGLIHGALPQDERQGVLARFREGRLRALTNVGVLTEGFDDPGVDAVAMARPTRSAALYIQCIGRGLRPHPGKRDCLVLDFADTSDLPLVTLPTLFGMPAFVDLEGEDAEEAARRFEQCFDEHPGFELDAEASITLSEIQARARAFDPLAQRVSDEVLSISPYAWFSLGRRGVGLWHAPRGSELLLTLVLARREGRERGYAVIQGGQEVARFSTVFEAVEAVDYEIRKRGPSSAESAEPDAAWRRGPIPPALAEALATRPLPRVPRHHGEARDLLAFFQHGPARRVPRRSP